MEMIRFSIKHFASMIILLVILVASINLYVRAQVPLVVDGYITMPDGSPATGASVTVTVSGGPSGSTSSGGDGYYRVDFTVSPGTRTVTVSASKDSYSGSNTGSGEAHIQVNVRLSAAPPPPPPQPPTRRPVSIQLNVPREAAVNTSVGITGKVTPRVYSIYLKVRNPKNILNEYLLQVASDGSFSFDFTPSLLGLYKVSAFFPGDVEYESASTLEYPLQVKARSILNLMISPSVVVAGAESIRINGSLYPPGARNISLYYSLDNFSWIFFAELNATRGVFSLVWEPRIFGDVFVKAKWAGNDTYTGSVAYGRFQTVLPSMCMLRSWVEKSPIRVGEEIRVNGVLTDAVRPETAELIMRVYQGGKEVETFRLNPSPDGVFTISYTPGSPGIYILILEASGVRLLKASNVTTVIVLGEVTLRAVNSTGGLVGEAVVELRHSEVSSSGFGELTAILDLGDYEVVVKRGEAEVFRGSLSLRSNGVFLTTLSQDEEFPLPITGKPLVIELRTKTYSLNVHVVNEFSEPAGDIEVKVVSSVFQTTGRTDAGGRIVFSNIPAGNYTVSTSAESKDVNLARNESVTLKGSGLNVKMTLIIETIALVALCSATLYFARRKPAAEK